MPILKTEAIVLRRFDYGDTSQIAQVLTRDYGKVSLMAKGIRSTKKKDRELFDMICHYGIVFQKKKHTHLHQLRHLQSINHFPCIRTCLHSVYLALYTAELAEAGTKEEEPYPELFDLLLDGLVYLNSPSGKDWRAFLLAFELKYLRILGYLPEFHFCLGCGIALNPPDKVFFSKDKGGILCRECRMEAGSFQHLSQGALSILRNLCRTSAKGLSRIRLLPAQEKELREIMGEYISHALEKRFKMNNYLMKLYR